MDISIIATIYSYEPIIAGVTKFGANTLYLLVDMKPNKEQDDAVKEVQKTLGNYITIHIEKTDTYDIVKVAEDSVKLIDEVSKNSKVLLNVSAARKTKALGLMFAGYARFNKVDKIFYITKEEKKLVLLPKLAFNLNKSQRKVLEFFRDIVTIDPTKKIYHIIKMSKSMYYKTSNELSTMGFIDKETITDAGRIALL